MFTDWERVAATIPAHMADAIEQNAVELGFADGSNEFYAECIGEAVAVHDALAERGSAS